MWTLFASYGFILCTCILNAASTTNVACLVDCECSENSMTCVQATVPKRLPHNITEVSLKGLNLDRLIPGSFSGHGWNWVTFLDLHSSHGYRIHNYSFAGLEELRHLGIHGNDTLQFLEARAFDGLDQVHTLDLSNSVYLDFYNIKPALDASYRPVLGLLTNLTLAKLYKHVLRPMNMDYSFFKVLSTTRSLTYLDISYTNINVLDLDACQRFLCDSIEYINAQKITLLGPFGFSKASTCRSLHTVDFTDTIFPITQDIVDFAIRRFNCSYTALFNSIENLYLSGIIPVATDIKNYKLNLTHCDFHFHKIIVKRNELRTMDMEVTLSRSFQESLTVLDLADNLLSYVSPNTLYPSINLETLNFSSNQLYNMQATFPDHFAKILLNSTRLRHIYLAGNQLGNLPHNFFSSNKLLEYIDLSRNKINSISFQLQHLLHLAFLDLSFNKIGILYSSVLTHLDQLYHQCCDTNEALDDSSKAVINDTIEQNLGETNGNDKHRKILSYESAPFQINLAGNPTECACHDDQLQYLDWLQTSNTVHRLKASYTCTFQGRSLQILTQMVMDVYNFCDLQIRLKVVKIAVPTTIAVILIAIVTALCVRNQQRKNKYHKTLLQQLKTNTYPKQFLVFLSFCSEDTDLVLTKIYPDLHTTLSEITENSKNLVCIGDRNFHLGKHITTEVARCIEDSAVVIFIVSGTFCRKAWCKSEVNEAYAQGKPIIMLMMEQVDTGVMPRFLRTIFNRYTHAAWVGNENDGHLEPDVRTIAESILRLASEQGDSFFSFFSKCWRLMRPKPPSKLMNEDIELQNA